MSSIVVVHRLLSVVRHVLLLILVVPARGHQDSLRELIFRDGGWVLHGSVAERGGWRGEDGGGGWHGLGNPPLCFHCKLNVPTFFL